jgi:hypothetical protein
MHGREPPKNGFRNDEIAHLHVIHESVKGDMVHFDARLDTWAHVRSPGCGSRVGVVCVDSTAGSRASGSELPCFDMAHVKLSTAGSPGPRLTPPDICPPRSRGSRGSPGPAGSPAPPAHVAHVAHLGPASSPAPPAHVAHVAHLGRPARLPPPLTWLTWLTWGRPARLPPPLTWLTWLT